MTQYVDARSVPAPDRVEFIAEMARTIIPVDISYDGAAPDVRGTLTEFSRLRLTCIYSNATEVARTPRQSEDGLPPSLMLGLQVTGSSLLVQDGREVLLRPGDLCIYRSTAPYTLVDTEGYRQRQLMVPLDVLELPPDALRLLTAVKLAPGHPVADLAAAFFYRLTAHPEKFQSASADVVSRPSVELLRALAQTHLDVDSSQSKDSIRAVLQLRILEYIRAHLSDPYLSAQQIAFEHHISIRQLYKVLGEAQISLGDWVRTHRLEGCRAELQSAAAQHAPIASVARKWGFSDPSSFGRLFRAEYGTTPREWRNQVVYEPPSQPA